LTQITDGALSKNYDDIGNCEVIMRLSSRAILIATHAFNAVSATAGGWYLMTSRWGALPPAWLASTNFPGFYFPGVILFAIVGGSAAIATMALWQRLTGAALVSLTAGTIMLYWIIGEIASIRVLHPLQLVYLVTGALALALTSRASK
jgi:hypothetical protein